MTEDKTIDHWPYKQPTEKGDTVQCFIFVYTEKVIWITKIQIDKWFFLFLKLRSRPNKLTALIDLELNVTLHRGLESI